jgi:hypothetical protein
VPDVDDENIIPSPAPMIYQPSDQEGWQGRLFVRTDHDPYTLVPLITRTVHDMAPDQPVERASTLKDIRAEVLTPDRLNAIVFGGFAGVALLISVVGVAGVLAFSVSGRTREFGIRMALGAQRRDILTNVLVEGLVIASIGVAAGVVVAFAFASAIGKYIAGVQLPGTRIHRVRCRTSGCGGDRVGCACRTRRQRERGGNAAFGVGGQVGPRVCVTYDLQIPGDMSDAKDSDEDCVGQFRPAGCAGYSVPTAGGGYKISEHGSGGGVHDGAEC